MMRYEVGQGHIINMVFRGLIPGEKKEGVGRVFIKEYGLKTKLFYPKSTIHLTDL